MSTTPFWVEDIGEAWRWLCMWVQGTGAALMTAFLILDTEQKNALFALFELSPEQGITITALITFISGMLARVKNQ